jgi:succinoglycan biosynthesis transport protein ExoP
MKNAQFTMDEVRAVLRRRKIPFFISAALVVVICIVGALVLPKQYVSSTTILMQGDAVLNPLVSYTMAVAMESDDQLRNFNEIVYSRPTIEALMDSLGMQRYLNGSIAVKEKKIKDISKNIKTARNSSNLFTISYYDTVPSQAQRAAMVLSELFIKTRLDVENRKNEFAVNFFTKKLNDLQDKFETTQAKLVEALKRQIDQLPEGDKTLYSQIGDYDSKIMATRQTIQNYGDALAILDSASKTAPDQHIEMSHLYLIPLLNVPYSTDLQKAASDYDQLSQQYTERYPDVQSARAKVLRLIALVKSAIHSEVERKQQDIWSMEKLRNEAITKIQEATVATSQNQDLQSNFNIYQQLYNEMKIKLEQAQTNRDLAKNSGQEYVVIDPPELPTKPAKPNRKLIVGAGFGLALFLGLLSAGLAELLDTRIRTPEDIEIFEKPIFAYLPPVESNREN